MTEVKVMFEGKESIFKFLPCPFSGVDPEVTIDPPRDWDGAVWAWIRVPGIRMSVHHGEYRSMRYEYNRKVVEFRTQEEATHEAVRALHEVWNTRKVQHG